MTILTHVLRRNNEVLCPHVDLLVSVSAGHDEEDAGTPEGPRETPAQPVDHGPLVLLDPLHGEDQGEGEGDDHEEPGEDNHQLVAHIGRVSKPGWREARSGQQTSYLLSFIFYHRIG